MGGNSSCFREGVGEIDIIAEWRKYTRKVGFLSWDIWVMEWRIEVSDVLLICSGPTYCFSIAGHLLLFRERFL